MRHYALIVRHFVSLHSLSKARDIATYQYPEMEELIPVWSNLDERFVQRADRVLIGYVSEFEEHLRRSGKYTSIRYVENEYYGSTSYEIASGDRLNLLGVKFSFWGNISAIICRRLCELGAREVIYFAKLGTLTSPDDIYDRVFVPSQYLSIDYDDKTIHNVPALQNKLLAALPFLDSGVHASVSTVLEEDYKLRDILDRWNVNTLDNEISQIANTISEVNRGNDDISFSAIHFATDYIRRQKERDMKTAFDLSNNRTMLAKEKKTLIQLRISKHLLHYLSIS